MAAVDPIRREEPRTLPVDFRGPWTWQWAVEVGGQWDTCRCHSRAPLTPPGGSLSSQFLSPVLGMSSYGGTVGISAVMSYTRRACFSFW